MKKKIILAIISLTVLFHAGVLKADIVHPLSIFTNNGIYSDGSLLNIYVKVIPLGSMIDFEFHNESSVDSSIARIYFDDSSMLSLQGIYDGAGTSFSTFPSPHNIPAGQELNTPFVSDFGAGADPSAPQNGVNPTESVTIRCNLINNATIENVIDALSNTDLLRLGVHIIALDDGSSEAAITPEPATLLLFGLGTLLLRKKNQKTLI
ncbi:MAG: PEP-CTERM sorting domain-containing protein [Planctomycetota bacterium]|jgi:hypothetical protein